MKVAYLIAAHSNYVHLDRLIEALNDEGARFFIHIDIKAKELYQPKLPNVTVLPERINVNWGCFSQVEAALSLLHFSMAHSDTDHFAYISGVDYPMRSNSFLYEVLAQGYEHINLTPIPGPDKPLFRFVNYYFEFDRRNKGVKGRLLKYLEQAMKIAGIRKELPCQLYGGSQWFVLSRPCVAYILEQAAQDQTLVRFFKTSLCSDEAFFHTIIGNSPYMDKVQPNLTYTDWKTDDWVKNPPPLPITEKHVRLFQSQTHFKGKYGTSTPFFARKFADNSTHVVTMIEQLLRH